LPIAYPLQLMATKERFLKSEPDLAEKLVKAFVAGKNFTVDPKKKRGGKAVLCKYFRLRSVGQAEEDYHAARAGPPQKAYVEVAGIASMIEFLSENDPAVAKIKPEQVINHTIMKRLDESGFIDHPFGK